MSDERMLAVADQLGRRAAEGYDKQLYSDLFSCIRYLGQTDLPASIKKNHEFLEHIRTAMDASQNVNDKAELYDQYKRALFYSAPYVFDDYLLAVEFDRPLEKKFYQPRRHYLRPMVQGYQDILDGKLDLLTLSLPKRAGKALTLDTLLPTPSGFKRMDDIRVGDQVIARDGRATTVTAVFPQGKVDVYEVTFTDGAKVRTCANHLWTVKYHDVNSAPGTSGYSTEVLTTGDMLRNGVKKGRGRGEHNVYSVEYCQPVEFAPTEVDLDPYVLGAILGDGTLRGSTVMLTSFDHEVTDYISAHLPEGDILYCQDRKKGRWIIRSEERRIDKRGHLLPSRTREAFERMGLTERLSHEKHIPPEYLFGSVDTRMGVLTGLMDTDGYADKGYIEYATTSEALRDGVLFLVRSLGGKATYSERMGKYRTKGKVVETRPNYRVHISFPKGVSPFKIERKRVRYQPKRGKLYHYIDSITYAGKEEAQCICVDNDEHLYLCTDFFVPTHNSQVGINFALMLSGRNPDRASLMEGAGDDLITSFYKGCLEYLMDTENYHFYDIFPDAPIIETNAKLKTINLQRKKRFPTIMCRSIDASQVGLSEATNLLYLDDCVQSREEAKNRQRLDDKWETIRGDVMGRAIEGTPIVATGTRYSLYDPIGRLQEYADSQHKRWRAIEIPALDPVTDESNYEYVREGKRVFTTAFFREQRELLSAEQFESEFQQQPFEAKGLLFGVKELNYYFELPVDQDPDAIIAVCDTAETGSDSTSLVIARVYGTEVYIVDVVFDDSPADVTKPQCAKALIGNNVGSAVFESNNAGSYYARDIAEMVKQRGYSMSIRTKRTISNKQTRIEFAADGIKKRFFFKHPSTYERGCQYWSFMRELTTYTRSGKVPHDDAPDSLSLLENELRQMIGNQVEIFARPF